MDGIRQSIRLALEQGRSWSWRGRHRKPKDTVQRRPGREQPRDTARSLPSLSATLMRAAVNQFCGYPDNGLRGTEHKESVRGSPLAVGLYESMNRSPSSRTQERYDGHKSQGSTLPRVIRELETQNARFNRMGPPHGVNMASIERSKLGKVAEVQDSEKRVERPIRTDLMHSRSIEPLSAGRSGVSHLHEDGIPADRMSRLPRPEKESGYGRKTHP
ncbi:hypothetical protein B0H11DRAFT_1913994 [Mycena galericulata]|nr:hypothetical protein B0H11DRAFT_1913994 [Mycena galericulata]